MISNKDRDISGIHKITLPKLELNTGNVTSLDSNVDLPFDIKRVFYTYDVPGGVDRGGHAHHKLIELVVAGSGSFDLRVDDGRNSKIIHLNRPYEGVIIPSGIWNELINFSSGSICLVMASELYSAEDYIRGYDKFKAFKGCL